MELDRKLWLTEDRKEVVEDGDPRAAFLLGNEGTEIPDAQAAELGLKARKSAAKAEDKQADAPPNKSASKKG